VAKNAGADKKPSRRTKEDRPSLVAKVCARLERGESLLKACDAESVKAPTFMDWMRDDPVLAEQYTRAREAGLHLMAQQIIEISDEQQVEARYQGEDVKLDLSATAVARNRLRVDARKWLLSKMMPKVYGDKLAIGGADDLPPIKTASDMTDDELLAVVRGKRAADADKP
jgi:hypothetical protein